MWHFTLTVYTGKVCRDNLNSRGAILTHSGQLTAKLLRMHSSPASRSLIKMSNWTGPRIGPWGVPLMTSYETDVAPFTTAVWALPPSQFITECYMYLLISQLDNLSRRMPRTSEWRIWELRPLNIAIENGNLHSLQAQEKELYILLSFVCMNSALLHLLMH